MVRYEYNDYTITEANIHPDEMYKREQDLAKSFIEQNVIKSSGEEYFLTKWGVGYKFDTNENLVADIQVSDEIWNQYFNESELAKLRGSQKYQQNTTSLRNEMWSNQIDWIKGRCFRYHSKKENLDLLDVGTRYAGWVEKLANEKLFNSLSIDSPLPPILKKIMNDSFDLIISFDSIQRQKNPKNYLENIYSKLNSDGIFIMTTRSGNGFDILSLKDKVQSIFPLDHLFLPSVKGMKELLREVGFEILEITTPGMLDVDIVRDNMQSLGEEDRLVKNLIEKVDKDELQGFLQKNNLSSHMRVVAKKVNR